MSHDHAPGAGVLATVASIRRYPVKAMAGEFLDQCAVDARGIVGDRWYAVTDGEGRLASGKSTRRFRRQDAVFAYTARSTADGVEVAHADGTWQVGDPALDAHLSAAAGEPMRVVAEAEVMHFDASPISLVGSATLDWCALELGVDADPRRLRVNIVLQTEEPFAEEAWVGRLVRIGTVLLAVEKRIERCRTIDVRQDGAAAEVRWLGPLADSRDMKAGIYAQVVEPGVLATGDEAVAVVGDPAVSPS